MRPYSVYLDDVKNPAGASAGSLRQKARSNINKSLSAQAILDLASSTPPIPFEVAGAIPKTLAFDPVESRRSEAYGLFQTQISTLSGFRAHEILPTLGSSSAFFQSLAAVTSPGDTVLIETPTYEPFVAVAQFLNLKIKRFKRTGDFETDLRGLRAGRASVLILSNPNCPTGWIYSAAQLKTLALHFQHVIVDEIFLPIFTGEATRAREAKNLISLSGLSKSLGLSSLRVGWVASSDVKLLRNCDRIGLNTHCDVPTLPLSAANIILPNWWKIIDAQRARVDLNRQSLREFASAHPHVLSHDFSFGHFGTLQVPKSFKSGSAFAQALLKKSVKVVACEPFGPKREIRLSAWISPKDFDRALSLIESFY